MSVGMFQIFNFALRRKLYFIGLVLDHRRGSHRLEISLVQDRYRSCSLDLAEERVFVDSLHLQILASLDDFGLQS